MEKQVYQAIMLVDNPESEASYFVGRNGVKSIERCVRHGEMAHVPTLVITFDDGNTMTADACRFAIYERAV